ncbi:MAG TPA: IS4 family transposase [Chloroflexota bacterium]|jgi:hypothetical protein
MSVGRRIPDPPPPASAQPVATSQAPVVGEIEQFLQTALGAMTPEARAPQPGRPRLLPALCLWAGVLVCVLRGAPRQLAVWRLLCQTGLWDFPRFSLSDQAIYRRLAAAGTAPLEQLFAHVLSVLQPRLAPYADHTLAPFASDVVALDESTLDHVARRLPALRDLPNGAHALLPGRLSACFDLRRQLWRTVRHVPDPDTNERRGAWALLAGLAPGTLVVADLGYFGFRWFDDLTTAGYFWVSRLRQKTSYRVAHVAYQCGDSFDGLVWLGAHHPDRARYLVRLVRFRLGETTYQYLTNVTDPALFPLHEIARVYQRRWDIELAFLLVKKHLGVRLVWASKPEVVVLQLWATLIISQVLQALRQEIAGQAGVSSDAVSMALLVQYAPQYTAQGQDVVAVFVTQGRALGLIRPARRRTNGAPHIPPQAISPPPPDLARERVPKYAHRRGLPEPVRA